MPDSISSQLPPAFSSLWWDDFLACTENLSRPHVLQRCFSEEKSAFYEEAVLQILREIAKLRCDHFGLRVYVDGKLWNGSQLDQLYDTPPLADESFAAWVGRLFGTQKFGMIIKSAEQFVPALSTDIALVLAPLLAKVGLPREGINQTIFMGNYDMTPLGIHQDTEGESVMHFHLGPGRKTMYLWPKTPDFPTFLREKNLQRSDVAALRAHATEFSFGRGDVFFMPEGTWHIGAQDGLSIGITVWQYNYNESRIWKNLHSRIVADVPPRPSIVPAKDHNALDDSSGIDAILQKFALAKPLQQLPYEELLRETYRDWRYQLHSNAGYIKPHPLPTDVAKFALDHVVQLEQPFKILVRPPDAEHAEMTLYVRGHKLRLKHFDCIVDMITRLNEGHSISVASLLALLDPSWSSNTGLFILGEIYRRRGIRLISPS